MTIFTLTKTVYLMGGFYEDIQTKKRRYNKIKKLLKWVQL